MRFFSVITDVGRLATHLAAEKRKIKKLKIASGRAVTAGCNRRKPLEIHFVLAAHLNCEMEFAVIYPEKVRDYPSEADRRPFSLHIDVISHRHVHFHVTGGSGSDDDCNLSLFFACISDGHSSDPRRRMATATIHRGNENDKVFPFPIHHSSNWVRCMNCRRTSPLHTIKLLSKA